MTRPSFLYIKMWIATLVLWITETRTCNITNSMLK